MTWAPELGIPALAQIPSRLSTPFEAPFDVAAPAKDGTVRPAVVPNCDAYFKLRPEGFEPLSQPDLAAFKVGGATCQALRALQTARPASGGLLGAFGLGDRSLDTLPPALGPAFHPSERDRRDSATSAGRSWRETDPDASFTPIDAWIAHVRGKDWRTELRILGRGDFDGDGRDDILIETISTGSEGSWSEIRLRLLTARPPARTLQVSREYPL